MWLPHVTGSAKTELICTFNFIALNTHISLFGQATYIAMYTNLIDRPNINDTNLDAFHKGNYNLLNVCN